MKKIILLILVYTSTTKAQQLEPAQDKAKRVLSEITGHIQKRGLYRDSINWEKLDTEISAINPAAYDPDSLMIPYIMTLYKNLRAAGDQHTFYIGPRANNRLKQENQLEEKPEVRQLDAHTGYIKVPQLLTFNQKLIANYADSLRTWIMQLDQQAELRGWVVDLRNNGGGTMWPMIAGLNPITTDGIAGYFIDDRNRADEWKTLSRNPELVGKLSNTYKCRNLNNRIAVLLDGKTGSSGEMTAISLLGLPNVKSFGSPTAGYTTSNQTIRLSNGGVLLLATKFAADRNRKIYKGPIIPDVNTTGETTLEKALEWVSQ